MANLKKVSTAKPEDENTFEEEVNSFEMLAGYVDDEGTRHTSYSLREMTGKDQEAVSKNEVRNNPSKVVNILLTRCVTQIGEFTPKSLGAKKWEELIRDLYVGDQDSMLLELHRLSIGEEIESDNQCPNCKEHLKTFIEVDELEVTPFNGMDTIEFELPHGYRDKKGEIHKEGTMRRPKGLDREILVPLARTNLARAETVMLTRLSTFKSGKNIDEDIMGNLIVKDREYLRNLLQDNLFGVKHELEITCVHCDTKFKGSLNTLNFL